VSKTWNSFPDSLKVIGTSKQFKNHLSLNDGSIVTSNNTR